MKRERYYRLTVTETWDIDTDGNYNNKGGYNYV